MVSQILLKFFPNKKNKSLQRRLKEYLGENDPFHLKRDNILESFKTHKKLWLRIVQHIPSLRNLIIIQHVIKPLKPVQIGPVSRVDKFCRRAEQSTTLLLQVVRHEKMFPHVELSKRDAVEKEFGDQFPADFCPSKRVAQDLIVENRDNVSAAVAYVD